MKASKLAQNVILTKIIGIYMPHFGSNKFNHVLNFDITPVKSKNEVNHCCQHMDISVNYMCDNGHEKWECADSLISYDEIFDEYGLIIHDGGASMILINYCPWCGKKLPESKRDKWFNELEKIGFLEPTEEDIPPEYRSCDWYKKNER